MDRSSRVPCRSLGICGHPAVFLLSLALAFSACQQDHTPELLGAWGANLLIEDGDTIEVKLDDVGLRFDEDGTYFYTSTLDYEETGRYRLEGDLLYRIPSTQQDDGSQLPVQIGLIRSDRLHLNMEEDGHKRRLEFQRIDMDGFDGDEYQLDHGDHDHSEHDHGHDHEH